MQPVREAIRAHGSALGSVIVERATGEAAGRLDALARFAEAQGVSQVERAPRSTLDRLAAGALHQGAVAWAPALRIHESAEVLAGESFLILALDGVQDPQNFGAAIRSAVALGATAIVWAEHSSAPLTPATFRASAGAIEHATLCRVPSLVRFLDDALGQGARVIGLAADGTVALHREDLRGSTVLVVGSEHEGLARAVRKRCTSVARLTLRGPVESLNASVAAAIAVHLAQIQRENSGS
ncbi:MAG TPA: RNA methyltransferase [Polyangiaceae bacterium]|nr:RNA methyltransferase [Polyangiaceae bacterium]